MVHEGGMESITANLIVASVEDSLTFWLDRLGFEKSIEVPYGEGLGFVVLKHGAVELMLQSRASLAADVQPLASLAGAAVLYIHVADLQPYRVALRGWPRVTPERTTFYGARELIVRDPDGHVVFFAAR